MTGSVVIVDQRL